MKLTLVALPCPIAMIVACGIAGGEPGDAHDEPGRMNMEKKAGDCDLHRSKHVVPFARSEAEPVLCRPEERQAMARMEACLDRLAPCRGGDERAWTAELVQCLSIAAPVSDGCLGARVGPPAPPTAGRIAP